MSIDSRYTWDAAQAGGSRFRGSRRSRFGWWVLVAVSCAIVLHAIALWALGRFNLWMEQADGEWRSKSFHVSEMQELPESVVPPQPEQEVAEPPTEAEDLLTEIEELIPELDDTEIDIVPDIEKPKVSLEPLKPAAIGEQDGELLEPLKAPEVQAKLEELGRGEPLFTEVPDSRVVIEEGSITADIPDPDAFLKDAAVLGAGGLDENGFLKGYSEFGRYLNFDVDQLDKGRAALPSDLLFEFNKAELKQNAKLGLMKLGMLIDRNPEMFCILEGHSDLFGTDPYNLELSRKRSQAVKDWLVNSLGLDSSHIVVRAYGNSKAKVLEGDQDQQAINRRVDILMRKQIPPQEVVPVKVKPNVLRPLVVPEPTPAPPRAEPVPEAPPKPALPAEPVEEVPPRAVPLEEKPPRAVPVPERILPAQPVN